MNQTDGLSYQRCQNYNKCNITGWYLVEYILFCYVLWWIFYYLLTIITKQSAEWCCRFVTFIHGCLVSYAAILDIYTRNAGMNFGNESLSEAQKNYLSYMLSYFLFDFCWIHFFGNETWVIYAHHVTSIAILVNVFLRSYGGDGVSYGVAGLEFSNPYLQLRWFLRTHGYLNKPIHTITEIWFIFVFFVIRMVGGTLLLYRGLSSSNVDITMKISFIGIYGISLVLQWQIITFVKKKYFSPEARRGRAILRARDSMSPYFQRRTTDYFDRISDQIPHTVVHSPTVRTALVESDAPAVGESSKDDEGPTSPVKDTKPPNAETVLIGTINIKPPEVIYIIKEEFPHASHGASPKPTTVESITEESYDGQTFDNPDNDNNDDDEYDDDEYDDGDEYDDEYDEDIQETSMNVTKTPSTESVIFESVSPKIPEVIDLTDGDTPENSSPKDTQFSTSEFDNDDESSKKDLQDVVSSKSIQRIPLSPRKEPMKMNTDD